MPSDTRNVFMFSKGGNEACPKIKKHNPIAWKPHPSLKPDKALNPWTLCRFHAAHDGFLGRQLCWGSSAQFGLRTDALRDDDRPACKGL